MFVPLLAFFFAIGYGSVDDSISLLYLVVGMAALLVLYIYSSLTYFWTRKYRDAKAKLSAQSKKQATLESETDEENESKEGDSL
jgi:Ca2+/Na+ antiporter